MLATMVVIRRKLVTLELRSGRDTAIRKFSVAKTAKGYGSAVAASAVYSETDLRSASPTPWR